MAQESRYIDSLTPLRGIAAIWVVIFHYNEFLKFMGLTLLSDGSGTALLAQGYLCVDFFFILSGFIITHVYGQKLRNRSKGTVGKYLWARFSRLYPLHLFCMLLMALFAWKLKDIAPEYYAEGWGSFFPMTDFFAYLFFGISFGVVKEYSWNLPAWSIAAEWWTYIAAVSIIPFLLKGSGKRMMVVGGVAFAGLAVLSSFKSNGSLDYTLDFGLGRCLLEFTLGIGVYRLYQACGDANLSMLRSSLAFALASIGTLAVMHFPVYDVLILPFFSALILSAALNRGVAAKILNSRPLRFLGDISYSVYMLQLFFLCIWNAWVDLHWKVKHPDTLPNLGEIYLWLAIILLSVISMATLTYRFVEISGREALRNLLKKEPLPVKIG